MRKYPGLNDQTIISIPRSGLVQFCLPLVSYFCLPFPGSWVSNGVTCGTPGGNQIEAIKIKVSDYGVTYRAHVAINGWLSWVSDGAVAGTTGEGKALEAI